MVNTRPLDLPAQELPLAPYALGVWLGDGHAAVARITTADPEIVVHLEADGLWVVPGGGLTYSLRLPAGPPGCGTILHRAGRAADPGRPRRQAHPQRIYGHPRRNDGRSWPGCSTPTGPSARAEWCSSASTSRRLAEDTRELIVSLGYRCSLTTKPVRGRTAASSTAYTLTFSTTDEVFRLERKRLLHKERRGPGRTGKRLITAVRPVPSVPVRCVEVDSPDHLYLASRSMVPTHNSTMGLDIARHAAVKAGVPTVVFSLEMSKTELVQRLMCAECTVDMQRLRTGRMEESDWTRLTRSLGKLADAPLFIDDSPGTTMMEIRAKCRRLKQRHGLGLVVVDYLQLMQPSKRFENRQQEVSEISRSLKLLAKELDVPVIAISQLSRQTESRSDRRPMLSDLRENRARSSRTRTWSCSSTGTSSTTPSRPARGRPTSSWPSTATAPPTP